MEKSFIRNIIRKDDIARISVIGVEDVPGKAFEIFSVLSEQNICIDIILQTAGRDNKKDIIFTIEEVDAEKVLESLYELFREDYQIEYTRDVSKISIIGAGMINNPGVAASVFKTVETFEESMKLYNFPSAL